MAIDPNQFWGSNYYNHPSLNDAVVEEAEKRLGVTLPPDLIALLRVQNGGYTKGFAHPMKQKTTWADDHVPLHDLAGIVTDPTHQTPLNILQTEYLTHEWGLPSKLVLLSGDGHWWITLDYRNSTVPSVAWIDVECGEDVQVARSFSDFLSGLLPDAEYESAQQMGIDRAQPRSDPGLNKPGPDGSG